MLFSVKGTVIACLLVSFGFADEDVVLDSLLQLRTCKDKKALQDFGSAGSLLQGGGVKSNDKFANLTEADQAKVSSNSASPEKVKLLSSSWLVPAQAPYVGRFYSCEPGTQKHEFWLENTIRQDMRFLSGESHELPMPQVDQLPVENSKQTPFPQLKSPKLYVVSTETQGARRKLFAEIWQRASLPFEYPTWWKAVDSESLKQTTIPKIREMLFGLKLGELGCYLSHYSLWMHHVDNYPDRDLIVLEDDMHFHPNFVQEFGRFLSSLPNDWDYLNLGTSAFWDPVYDITPQHAKVRSVLGTWGYVIKPNKIPYLLNQVGGGLGWARPIDTMIATLTCQGGLNAYVNQVPLVLRHDGFGSQTDNSNATDYIPANHEYLIKEAASKWAHLKPCFQAYETYGHPLPLPKCENPRAS